MSPSALALLALLSTPPGPRVSAAGARLAGIPWAAHELHKVAHAESRNTVQAEHAGLNRRGRDFHRRALAVGWLAPCQDYDPDAWGVRGTYGLVAAYHVRHLGACVRPEAVDVPLIGAYLAALSWERLRRSGLCDYKARRTAYKKGAHSPEARAERARCRQL